MRYPEVRVEFSDSRRFAEAWTYRLLSSALADVSPGRLACEALTIGRLTFSRRF